MIFEKTSEKGTRHSICLCALFLTGMLSFAQAPIFAQATASPAAGNAAVLYSNNFESLPEGPVPDEVMVLNGEFAVKVVDGNHVLQLPGAPLDAMGVMFGPSAKDNIEARARIQSTGRRRNKPQFGIGLNGARGYKLQVAAN